MSTPEPRSRVAFLIALLVVLAACTATPMNDVSEQEVAHAQEALLPFKQELKAALVAGLEEGPVAAIQACRTQAPGIAAAQTGDGVIIGRTSHQLRNPDNAPRAWMEPLLATYAEGTRTESVAVRIDDATIGYVEPIYVQAMCLTCHGSAVEASTLAKIHALYPNDDATGFEEGDFRGLFWVELDTSARTASAAESR